MKLSLLSVYALDAICVRAQVGHLERIAMGKVRLKRKKKTVQALWLLIFVYCGGSIELIVIGFVDAHAPAHTCTDLCNGIQNTFRT